MKVVVVLTGAGISAESGLQTFRDSKDGLWEGHSIEEVATPEAWHRDPKKVLQFYNWRRKQSLKAQPNKAHTFLAEMESKYDIRIVTQNVDNLHERAGSTDVLHLHGELCSMRSENNPDLTYEITGDIEIGEKAEDGAQLRPDIVWFGEAVPNMDIAIKIVQEADVLMVIGTSLQVYPAASLLNFTKPDKPIFVLDKKVPTNIPANVVAIEKPATQGIEELFELIN